MVISCKGHHAASRHPKTTEMYSDTDIEGFEHRHGNTSLSIAVD